MIRNLSNIARARLVLWMALLAGAVCSHVFSAPGNARYVFLFIGDGMGVPHVQLAEEYLHQKTNAPGEQLVMNTLPALGLARTRSYYSFVTDSAAGGTALSSGRKTNNGVLGLDWEKMYKYVSISELAQQAGKRTGVVSTDALDGATPASFYAHQPDRKLSYAIGTDLLRSKLDVCVAGHGFGDPQGEKIPEEELERLTNELSGFVTAVTPTGVVWRSLIEAAPEYGSQWVPSAEEFMAVSNTDRKVIAVCDFTLPGKESSNTVTLAAATRKSIELLDNSNGFFLMVEGAHVDKHAHGNDGAAVLREVLALDRAIAEACAFYTNHPDETLIVVTADHETGALTLGHGSSKFRLLDAQPETVWRFRHEFGKYRATHSSAWLPSRMLSALFGRDDAGKHAADFDDVKPLLTECFGLGDAEQGLDLSTNEWCQLERAFNDSMRGRELVFEDPLLMQIYGGQDPLQITAIRMLNEKAGIKWSTLGHSGSVVPVFALGVGSERLVGWYDNTDIPRAIMAVMLPDVAFPGPVEKIAEAKRSERGRRGRGKRLRR